MQVRIERTTATLARVILGASEGRDVDDVALDGEGLEYLDVALERLAREPELRALLLVSAGGTTFCRGMDLTALAHGVAVAPEAAVATYARVLERLAGFPRPTLCAVEGEVRGGGVGLVAVSDLVFASTRASFSLPEVVWGLVPAVVWPALLRRVAPHVARGLAITAVTWTAEQAAARGLVDEAATDRPGLARAVDEALRRIHRASPDAIARVKAHAASVEAVNLQAGLALGIARTQVDLASAALVEGLAAVRDGTLPPWSTRWSRRGEALLDAGDPGSTTSREPGNLASPLGSEGTR